MCLYVCVPVRFVANILGICCIHVLLSVHCKSRTQIHRFNICNVQVLKLCKNKRCVSL